MKVIYLTYEFPPFVYGGAGIHIKNLVKELSKYIRIEVRCAGDYPETKKNRLIIKRYVSPDLTKKDLKNLEVVFKTLFMSIDMASEFKTKANIIHVHTLYPSLAGILLKKLTEAKLIVTLHTIEPRRVWKQKILKKGFEVTKWLEQNIVNESNGIIVTSQFMKNETIHFYGVNKEKICIIPNGINSDIWKPSNDYKVLIKYGIKKPYLLFVGRITEQKGVNTLFKIIKLLPKITFVLKTSKADSQSLLKFFKEKTKKYKNIIWINRFIPTKELMVLYSMAEFLIMPSIYEPFGITALESMSCKRPVIASNTGGLKEIISHKKTGILIQNNDPFEFVKEIKNLLANPEERDKMGEIARKNVIKHYSWKEVAKKTIAYYKKVMNEY